MKSSLQIVGAVIIAAVALSSCAGSSNQAAADKEVDKNIIGTYHYETMAYTVLGAAADTTRRDFVEEPEGDQYYDVYRPDSVLEFYVTRNDSLLLSREYRYIFRNDTIFAENDEKSMTVHVANATDSTLCFDYTRDHNDTTYYFRTKSRLTELPDWLKKQIKRQ